MYSLRPTPRQAERGAGSIPGALRLRTAGDASPGVKGKMSRTWYPFLFYFKSFPSVVGNPRLCLSASRVLCLWRRRSLGRWKEQEGPTGQLQGTQGGV